MKKVFLILLAIAPTLLFAQTPDNFTVKGKVGNLNTPARAYLIYEAGNKNVIDSTAIINGTFSFHGHIADPAEGYVVMDPLGIGIAKMQQNRNGIDALEIYIDKDNIVLSPVDSVAKAEVSGSKLNDDNKRFKAMLAPYINKGAEISATYRDATDAQKISPVFQDTIQARYAVVQNQETAALKKFIADNPKSFMSLIALRMLIKSGTSVANVEQYFTPLSPVVKETELGKGFASAIAGLKVAAIGTMAPDFTQNDANGMPVKLSSLRGQYVLIDFWASWCAPCRQENPHVVRVYNQYKTQKFTILGVSLDKPEDKAAWLKAIKDDGLTWTQVSDLKYWQNEVALMYKVEFIPQNFLIDPSGKIIAKNLKGAELDSKMKEIFKM